MATIKVCDRCKHQETSEGLRSGKVFELEFLNGFFKNSKTEVVSFDLCIECMGDFNKYLGTPLVDTRKFPPHYPPNPAK